MGIFSKKEVNRLVIAILILGFIFGYNDKADVFNWNHWLTNFVLVLLVVSISVLLHQLVQKLVAKKYGCQTEFDLWKIKRYSYRLKDKFPKKVGPWTIEGLPAYLFSIFITLISNGLWFFAATGTTVIETNESKRIGRVFPKITGMEKAIVIFSGALVNLLLVLVLSNLAAWTGINFDLFIIINLWICVFSLVPLPGLEGLEILFGSLSFYIFSIAFFAFSLALSQINFILATITTILISFAIMMFYIYIYEKK
ncbi:MAG: hypothetical protein PHD81_02110 [Candidatus Nanoarchaeia archaeon]|nr:hypothetical protein [Candidatus Nanoarchaeia archaeon]MDD5587884.1 hypothetical protein [Candidatus Nanoarchaeia archaeon]